MSDVTPQQTKVEAGGTLNAPRAEVHDRAGLYVGIVGLAVAMLAIGLRSGDERATQVQLRQHEQQVIELRAKVATLESQVNALSARTEEAISNAAIAKNNSQKLEARLNERR